MSDFLSNRLKGLVQSDIRAMTRECVKLGGINMGQGVCDLPTPPLVKAGAIDAIEKRKSLYSPPEGIPELRNAIAQKLERDNQIKVDPNHQITITSGSTGGYAAALMGLLNPGDGILLFEPYYGYHLNAAVLAQIEPQYCTLKAPKFEISRDAILASLKPNTRAIVLCTPTNPSGKMFTEEEIRIIGDIANEKDLLLITDEIYEYYRYDGKEHISAARFSKYADRTVTLMGLSKTFSITGWRLGYAIAPPALSQRITLATDLFYVCAPTPLQHAVAEGFKSPPEYFERLQEEFKRKRDQFCGSLEKAGLTPIVPQGAYYVLADVTKFEFRDSKEASMTILEKAKVASVPGRSFYQSSEGEKLVRFCFAIEDEKLDEACKNIESFPAKM